MECYEKTLTITDINQKLIVPMDLLGNLFPDPNPDSEPEPIPIPLSFKDEWGKEYTFHLTVRPRQPGQERYYKKPEFMFRGWHALVVEKELEVGERIFLWRDDRGGHLRIRARHPPSLHRLFRITFLH
ncbi:hypothetical protein TIFTF001_036451 [Ficus carica]|uniref:TF-B3 domain-containing protein n=1 Tax=Ficus carica TaxID=3494 RepID=A0AA88E3D7_FICCA|nr:hypothetical protein TIFTF001_036451 [Ficus carica]